MPQECEYSGSLDPVLFLEGYCLIAYVRLVEFGQFLLLLSNFSSFVLCKNLYNYLLHVVASPFCLNYLPTCLLSLYPYHSVSACPSVPNAQIFLSFSLYGKARRQLSCNEPAFAHHHAFFFHSPHKVFAGKDLLHFCSREWWKILTTVNVWNSDHAPSQDC